MKQILRIAVVVLCHFMGMAVEASAVETPGTEYTELFCEGKEWNLYHLDSYPVYLGPPNDYEIRYKHHAVINVKVDGSKTVEGIECKRLVVSVDVEDVECTVCNNWLRPLEYTGDPNVDYYWEVFKGKRTLPEEVYVYEKDRKIYFYRDPGFQKDKTGGVVLGDPHFELFMNLNATVGDKIDNFGRITSVDEIDIEGTSHRRIITTTNPDNSEWTNTTEWIEGIGASQGLSLYEPYYNNYGYSIIHLSQPVFILGNCKQEGRVIYDQSDLLKSLGVDVATSVGSIEEIAPVHNKCYDLMGHPINRPIPGQPFIQNGKIHLHK